MSPQRRLVRKIIYLVAMAVLLMVLAWLGQPATIGEGTEKGTGGGVLARLREEHNLSEAQLGEIDPTSETMKLATLGLRGVAVNILWEKSNKFKMKKDWANLAATLEQIIRLEPHFSKVWYYQGWNLSYNVSVEFDDYRERYRWVIKGIEFLKKGIRYNRNDPILYRDVGWFIAQKIGRADESKQFRQLFREDKDFHDPETVERDNWLVGKQWFRRAEEVVAMIDPDDPTKGLKKVSPVVFYSNAPMCQMNYSEYLWQDGTFGEKAQMGWRAADRDWQEFGNRPLPGLEPNTKVRLNDKETYEQQAAELVKTLEAMAPGLRDKIREERLASLTAAERKARELPPDKRTAADWELAGKAEEKLRVTHEQVARRVPGRARVQAQQIARQAVEAEKKALEIAQQRTIVNFEYWQRRAQVEQTRDAVEARELAYQAQQAKDKGDVDLARQKYEQAFAKWRQVFDNKAWPDLKTQAAFGEELVKTIYQYRRVLKLLGPREGEDLSKKIFPDILELHEKHVPDED